MSYPCCPVWRWCHEGHPVVPSLGEPVSSKTTASSADTVLLKLQKTHKDNCSSMNSHHFIKQTMGQHLHDTFLVSGESVTVGRRRCQQIILSFCSSRCCLEDYMSCFGNLMGSLTFHTHTQARASGASVSS